MLQIDVQMYKLNVQMLDVQIFLRIKQKNRNLLKRQKKFLEWLKVLLF